MGFNGFSLNGKVREIVVTGAVPYETLQVRGPADTFIALILSIILPHWSSAQKYKKNEIKIVNYFVLCEKWN